MKHQGFSRIPWKSLKNLGFQFKDEGSVSRNTTDKSRVELLKYPSIFQGHSLKILEFQGKDRGNDFKGDHSQVKGWTIKISKDFSRATLENPQTSSQGWGLQFQGLWLTSQGLKTKKDRGFFKAKPWKSSNFQGKDEVRFSRNLATLDYLCLITKDVFWKNR